MRREIGLTVRPYTAEDFRPFYLLYSKVFAEPPWREDWTETAVKKEVEDYMKQRNLNFLLAKSFSDPCRERLIGFGVAYEVDPEVFPARLADLLRPYRLPIVYGDELAVDSGCRGFGVGSMLMRNRFDYYKSSSRDGAISVGRTDMDSKMVYVYRSLGYENSGINDPEYNNRYYFIKRL